MVAALAAAGPVTAQDDPVHRVRTLVRQLDDDSVQRRAEAEAALLAWGPAVLDLLPPREAIASPEARQRLGRIREALETRRAQQFLAASRVRLEGTLPIAAALRAVEQQTGNRLLGGESFDRRIVADLADKPFWEALDAILDQAALTVAPAAGRGGGLQVLAGAAHRTQHAAYCGVFRLEPTLVTAIRDLRQPALSTLRVRLSVAWEPRIRPIVITQRLESVAAQDDQGRALEVSRRGSLSVAVQQDASGADWEVVLGLPDRPARHLAVLSGAFDALLPGPVEQFTFSDLRRAAHSAQRRVAAVVSIQEIRAAGAELEIVARVVFDDALDALESYRGWVERNAAYLVDAAGRRVDASSQRLVSQQPDAVEIAVRFPAEPAWADCRFVYETPALLVRVPVPYTLRDIELP